MSNLQDLSIYSAAVTPLSLVKSFLEHSPPPTTVTPGQARDASPLVAPAAVTRLTTAVSLWQPSGDPVSLFCVYTRDFRVNARLPFSAFAFFELSHELVIAAPHVRPVTSPTL